ncbi:MAG TPA: hypothetical protein PLJ37_00915 [Chitinophagales bacterium]|nr:hypothetical protein [Chitinophagales bacterium]HMW93512.1 hypothetical protein [Chitinophagales bacterium]HMZ92990.1 hypothetical protein [Chitinophagales bacterium]HNG25947.1 hypothetical protein [Chitinophagales bacterium]
MIISKEKIEKIRSIIDRYYNALVFKVAGTDYLTDEQVVALIESNLINAGDSNGAIKDAYYIGRLRNVNDPQVREADINLADYRRKYRDQIAPLTDAEKYSLEHAEQSAGSLITGLREKVKSGVDTIIFDNNLDYRNKIITEQIKPIITAGIEERRTVYQIASDLREKTQDNFRDWKRVSVNEVATAMNLGEVDAIVERNKGKSANEIYVFKRVNQDAALCPSCKKAYLVDGTQIPKVFKLSELQANGTNYGKKASEYLPTITPLHINCRCALVEIPPGWSFNEEGQMIYKGPNYNQYTNQ